jgi:hypothetical protein
MEKPVIILFNGFSSQKLYWEYGFEGKSTLKKLDFLDNLKKIGKVYTFNQPFFNLNYYLKPNKSKESILWTKINKRYKLLGSNVNFKLEDLDYKNICEKVYNNVIEKYGKRKYIVIGHSYGGPIALLFAKLYKSDCILCCCIDNVPYILSYYKKYDSSEDKHILKKYFDNAELKKSIKLLKTGEDEIGDLYKLIGYRLCQDRIKYYDSKLYVPTIIFKSQGNNVERDKYNLKEQKLFSTDKNLKEYKLLKNAEHYVWNDQVFSDIIINSIKTYTL